MSDVTVGSPIGSVTDELDVLEVFLSRCFGFSLRWSCRDGRTSTLKHTHNVHDQLYYIMTDNTSLIMLMNNELCSHIHGVISLRGFWVPAVITAQLGHFCTERQTSVKEHVHVFSLLNK